MSQQDVIENIEGIYLVDAGAGTGKTYTITKRYANLLKKGKKPKDMLLVTFTRNAAENMKESIINECQDIIHASELIEAPIFTFHSLCSMIIRKYGSRSAMHFGIDTSIANASVIENETLELELFRKFYFQFKISTSEKYNGMYRVLNDDYAIILTTIKKLCSRGIFPKQTGWYMEGDRLIRGNFETYKAHFDSINEPIQGLKKLKKSELLDKFEKKTKDRLYLSFPDDIIEELKIADKAAEIAFNEDREELMVFMHDIYLEYIRYMVLQNRLNFDFLVMFAFITLFENDKARVDACYDYIMVDEFQDTDEIQFMMILLLMKKDNLCAVGDWKQGIYGFRNCTIENILGFEKRISDYKDMLNADRERIVFNTSITPYRLDINYRSSQKILDFSRNAFSAKGKKDEIIDEQFIADKYVPLTAHHENLDEHSEIKLLVADDIEKEIDMILAKIHDLISTEKYIIIEDGKERRITYSDIAVISSRRIFGLTLQKRAIELGIPVSFESGLDIYRTEYAILTLAWLRLLQDKDHREGWLPILDKAGYIYAEKKEILKDKSYPSDIMEFLGTLSSTKDSMDITIQKIFDNYGWNNAYCNSILIDICNVQSTGFMTIKDIIRYIEDSYDNNIAVDSNEGNDSVKAQTMHSSKGLEYPVVIIADCNDKHFPLTKPEFGKITYSNMLGLRLKNAFGAKNDYEYIFNRWEFDLLSINTGRDYDEFRRLLYVAITRAKQYLYMTASKPSTFFHDMGITPESFSNIVQQQNLPQTDLHDELHIDTNYVKIKPAYSPHDFMGYTPDAHGRGIEYGIEMHRFAHKIASGKDLEPPNEEFKNVKDFIRSQAGKLRPEIDFILPLDNISIRGIIDLMVEDESSIHIIDYKTDTGKLNRDEYIKQMSIYYHAIKGIYPEKEVRSTIFWTYTNELEDVTPIEIVELSIVGNNQTS